MDVDRSGLGYSDLRGLKSGEAWRELLKQFQTNGLNDPDKVAFALWLFPKVIPSQSPELRVLEHRSEAAINFRT